MRAVYILRSHERGNFRPPRSRAAQCIDKEILISKNGNIDIGIEIDKRMY